MNRRIQNLSESPCYQCLCELQCDEKIKHNYIFEDIKNEIFANADFDYHECGIWIALNAPDMIEVEE